MAFGDFTVVRASTKLRIGSNGLYGSVANNVPAFEFNTDGSYRGLLVEPGATNLALRSQEFNDASWGKVGAGTGSAPVVTANDAVAPDGTMTADLIVFDRGAGNTSTDRSVITQAPTVVNATAYTASLFLKAATAGDVGKQIAIRGVAAAGSYLVVTLTANWVRYSRTETSVSTTGNIELANRGTFTVDNTVSVHVWQAQLETGSVATSPIVTTAGTASRVADVVSLTGASSLIGQTGGSLYVEFERPNYNPTVVQRLFSVTDGSATNRISVIINNATSNIELLVTNGGVSQASIVGSAITSSAKFAVGYALNDIAFYVNGASAGTDASATIPATSQVNVGVADTGASGTGNFQGWIRSVALFPTRLANATLASLTA